MVCIKQHYGDSRSHFMFFFPWECKKKKAKTREGCLLTCLTNVNRVWVERALFVADVVVSQHDSINEERR